MSTLSVSGRRSILHGTWPTHAACAGRPDVLGGDEQAAKALCAGCPVITDCTRWVIPLRPWEDPGGVVAGMAEDERNRARRRARGVLSNRARARAVSGKERA